MKQEKRSKIILNNMIWRFAERCGAQGVKLIVELVLARLLAPDDYGVIALVSVFITIFNVFVDSGLGSALVQKKNADEIDFSTVFWFNIAWCILLYVLLFVLAPSIESFYQREGIATVIRVLGLQIIISGVKNVEQAYVSRNLQFKKFFYSTLGGTIGAAVLGIWLAFRGFGVWALVAQQLFNTLVDTVILWFSIEWKPRFLFSFSRLKRLFSYGSKLLASSLLETLYTQLRNLIIGKKYSASDLAFYHRGCQFPDLFINNVNNAIDSVLLPTMAKEQDDKVRMKQMVRRSIKMSTYIMAPFMMGLAAVGTPFIRILLTEKWVECVPYMRIFCITYMFYPIHTSNLNALRAMGRSDLYLKLEVQKKIVGLIALVLTMNISVMAMAYSLLFTSIASQLINTAPNKKLLDYGYIEQIRDILPSIGLSVAMAIAVAQIEKFGFSDPLTLAIQIFAGVIFYIAGSQLLQLDSFLYLKELLLTYFWRGKNEDSM